MQIKIMKLSKYFSKMTLVERKTFLKTMSEKLCKSPVTIRSYINGHKKIQAQDVQAITELTRNSVTKQDLRPDVFYLENEGT